MYCVILEFLWIWSLRTTSEPLIWESNSLLREIWVISTICSWNLTKNTKTSHICESASRDWICKIWTKCRFAVSSGEVVGYLVTYRGIEANPKHINALIEIASPKNKQEVQRPIGIVRLSIASSQGLPTCVYLSTTPWEETRNMNCPKSAKKLSNSWSIIWLVTL